MGVNRNLERISLPFMTESGYMRLSVRTTSTLEIVEVIVSSDRKLISALDSVSLRISFKIAELSRYQLNIVPLRASP
ncbi:unannotated protein [freshwater metagenome]|uniref:Unannotated protein n=1 Tax=freshwater metagenome TaxID=449393 RepID=A0A6J7AHK4_9ZZZZ